MKLLTATFLAFTALSTAALADSPAVRDMNSYSYIEKLHQVHEMQPMAEHRGWQGEPAGMHHHHHHHDGKKHHHDAAKHEGHHHHHHHKHMDKKGAKPAPKPAADAPQGGGTIAQ